MSSVDFFQNHLFRKILSVSNTLDPDQARHFVGPNVGPNCLQGLSADDKIALIMQRIEYFGRMAINSHGRQPTSQQGLQLMIECSVNEPGKMAA